MKNAVLLLPKHDTFRRFTCTLEIFDLKWLTQDSHSKDEKIQKQKGQMHCHV